MPPFSMTPSAPTRHRSTCSIRAPTALSSTTRIGMPAPLKMRAESRPSQVGFPSVTMTLNCLDSAALRMRADTTRE